MVPRALLCVVVAQLTWLATACTENRDLIDGPAPGIEAVQPDLLCVAQAEKEVAVTGNGFAPLVLDAATDDARIQLPAVILLPGDGAEIQVPAEDVIWESQQSLKFVLRPTMALEPGAYRVTVRNGSGQEASLDNGLTVVPPPTLAGVSPDLFCGAQEDVDLVVHGDGFLQIGSDLPTITIEGEAYPATAVGDCTELTGSTLGATSCKEATFTLPAGALEPGWHDISLANPPPADCEQGLTQAFYLLPPPDVTAVGPTTACDQAPTDLTITGVDFDENPQVTVEGAAATVEEVTGCAPAADNAEVTLCTGIRVTVPAGTVDVGAYDTTVSNPGDPGCEDTHTSHIGPPPVVSAISPLQMCASGGTLTVQGENFNDGAVVSIGNADHQAALDTTFVDENTLEATLPNPTPPGLYDVTVTNPDGCEDTLVAILDVTPVPVVYFADPSVLYNGVNIQVTLYTSGILGAVTEVTIHPNGQPDQVTTLTFIATDVTRIQAVVPAGLAPGSYDVWVEDDVGCLGGLANALEVVEELTVAVDRMELPFGWTDARTGVNVYAPETPDPGLSNFLATPRFYLNPADAGPDTVASELKHTAFVSVTRVSSVVPAGLPVGMYDLIVVNPDGVVGLLTDAFEVTTLPPPTITTLAPASVVNQETQETTILGANFRTPAFSADCLQPDDTSVALIGTVLSNDDVSIQVEFDFISQTIADGSICIVRVTNDDGTYALYSALGITNPSLNLEHFSATTDMTVARRAPCALAGDATPGARFVYALGGDDGNTQETAATTYLDTVEMAAIDPYGELEAWQVLPNRMPAARSFHACVSIGRYLFVVGGQNGAAATNTAWRAKILDPEEAPEIDDVDLDVNPDELAVLAPGRYSYRVSAVRPAGDPENPGGETLAGDPLQIQTPDIVEQLSITIAWTEVAGSVAYRVYRTPEPDLPSGNEVLIAEVDGATRVFTDDGTAAPGVEEPLPLGAVGRFFTLPSLGTPREGAGIAWATDPSDAGTNYIYLLGGRDDNGNGLSSVEWLTVQVLTDGTQAIGGSWITGAADIGPARWQLQAFAANDLTAPDVMPTGETWIYAGGGIRDDLQFMEPEVVALLVEPGGTLGEGVDARYVVDEMQPFRAGYASAIFNNQLFAFGGVQGMASFESGSIEMCGIVSGACSPGIPDPPDLANWNSLGIDLTVPRYLTSGVTVSAFVFLVGGVDDAVPAAPLAATEKTLW